jgi:hypothetical protein
MGKKMSNRRSKALLAQHARLRKVLEPESAWQMWRRRCQEAEERNRELAVENNQLRRESMWLEREFRISIMIKNRSFHTFLN